MKRIPFTKMAGAGNDFVVIEGKNKINYSLELKNGNTSPKKLEYDFKTGDKVRFKKENGKFVEGDVTAINNTTAIIKYLIGVNKCKEIEISFNKLYKVENKENPAQSSIKTEKSPRSLLI